MRCSDFTVGDFWGVEKTCPEFDDNKGCSLMFLNSEKAVSLFESISISLEFQKITEKEAVQQPNLKHSSQIPKKTLFWKMFNRFGMLLWIIVFCFFYKGKNNIKMIIKKLIRYEKWRGAK